MILLDEKVIVKAKKKYSIERFDIYWLTPLGIIEDYDDCVAQLSELGLSVNMSMRPVVVAVHNDSIYEIMS